MINNLLSINIKLVACYPAMFANGTESRAKAQIRSLIYEETRGIRISRIQDDTVVSILVEQKSSVSPQRPFISILLSQNIVHRVRSIRSSIILVCQWLQYRKAQLVFACSFGSEKRKTVGSNRRWFVNKLDLIRRINHRLKGGTIFEWKRSRLILQRGEYVAKLHLWTL